MADFRETNDFIERKRIYASLSRLLITDANGGSMISDYEDGWTSAISKAMDMIMDTTAADVRPVVHGKWIEIPGTRIDVLADFRCSVCEGRMSMSSDVDLGWCGRCGAKMDGKDIDK